MKIEPGALAWRDVYKLMTGIVVPRPIAFVSTVSRKGIYNLAAFSFFNAVCPKPFVISFAPMNRTSDGGKKDTLQNIEQTGEFVVNIVTQDIVQAMNETAPEFSPEVDEFEVSGLTPIDSVKVTAPSVAQSPIHLECKLIQVVNFGSEPGSGSLVLGEVVHMSIHDEILEDGKINPDLLKPVARMAGNEYTLTTNRFVLERPKRL